jgi:hypothetical protein
LTSFFVRLNSSTPMCFLTPMVIEVVVLLEDVV